MDKISVFTDGSCLNNPGVGGYAICIVYDDQTEEVFSIAEDATTNNRMEIKAVLLALEKTKHLQNVEIYTDSSYVVNGFNQWMHGWQRNNWINSQKQAVANIDLWQEMLSFAKICISHKILWIKGHNKNKYNEAVDLEAKRVAKELQTKLRRQI